MFAPGAARFIGPEAAVAIVTGLLGALGGLSGRLLIFDVVIFALAAGLAVFFAIFFRDPERAPGEGIVSAADGRVRAIEVDGGRLRISVFMNVTNVHVNRLPLDATVSEISDSGHGYRPAYGPEASSNVQRRYLLSTALGPVEVIQMTGVVARRLVSFVRPGDQRRKGDRFGMVILGSRVDVLLPADRVEATVRAGDSVRAGTSSIAREIS